MDMWEFLTFIREFGRVDRILEGFWPSYQIDLVTFLLHGVIRIHATLRET